MSRISRVSPVKAWSSSLTRVLLWPFALYLPVCLVWSRNDLMGFFYFAIVPFVGVFVHFVSYCVIGLPIYSFFWESRRGLWTWKIGLPLGTILGAFTLAAFFSIVSRSVSGDELALASIVGGLYGLFTAAAAIVSRRRRRYK